MSTWKSRIVGHGEEAPDQLLANPENWRIHPKEQQDALAGVLTDIGWVQSVIVNRTTGHLVDGHLRVSLALRENEASIPVSYVDLSPEEERLVLATIDPIAGMAGTDGQQLAELLAATTSSNQAVGDLLDKLAQNATKALERATGVEVDIPMPPKTATSHTGDLWLLGEHRLFVGDATDAESWRLLFGEKRYELMWTDPPYGVKYEGGTEDRLTIDNDVADRLPDILRGVFSNADAYGEDGAALYVAHPDGPNAHLFHAAFLERGWRWHQTLIWAKDRLVLGHSDYHQRHEPILFGYRRGGGRRGRGGAGWYGSNNDSTLLEFPKPSANRYHPTMKPIPLVAHCIQNSARQGGIVVDPFCGSGTTILAAAQTGRIGYGIEVDPRYADVICMRYQSATGEKPVRASTKEAVSFEEKK